MQYATKSTGEVLNTRDAHRASARTEHTRVARAFWIRQARRSLQTARDWRCNFGGPLHHLALTWYLEALLDADRYRRWAHELGGALWAA